MHNAVKPKIEIGLIQLKHLLQQGHQLGTRGLGFFEGGICHKGGLKGVLGEFPA